MTTTPKSVIMVVVVVLGAIALAVVAGEIVLFALGDKGLPGSVIVMGAGAGGAVAGVLASPHSTPELPPGAQLTAGSSEVKRFGSDSVGQITPPAPQA